MHCHHRILVKSAYGHIGPKLRPQLIHRAAPSLYIYRIRYLHVSQPRYSVDPPATSTSASATVQMAENSLKIASASGNTPPPEDPEDSLDHEPPRKDDIPFISTARPAPTESFARPASRARGRPRGSSSRRGLKGFSSRKAAGFKPKIPEWFISRNVTLYSSCQQVGPSTAYSDASNPSPSANVGDISFDNTPRTRVFISPYIRKELEAHLSAALLVQPGGSQEILAARKTHILVQCQRRGAIYFLDEIVESAATPLEADVVRLDAQDLDELLEMLIDPGYPEMGLAHPQIFFTNIMRDHSKRADQRDEIHEEENEELEEDEETTEDSTELRLPPDMSMRLFRLFSPRPMFLSGMYSGSSTFSNPSRTSAPRDDTNPKVSTYLDLLISAPIDKRKSLIKILQRSGSEAAMTSQTLTGTGRTIVYLRDFQGILDTPRGQLSHQTLLNVIHNRRRLGEKIVLVVSDDLGNQNLTSTAFADQHYHIIKIPPPMSRADKIALQEDRDARTREINLRAIQSAIRQRSRSPAMEFECPVGIHLDASTTQCIHGLDRDIWELSKVQRVVSIAMGNHGRWLVEHKSQQTVPITIADIAQAVGDIERADKERAGSKQEQKAARVAVEPLKQQEESEHETSQLPPINSKDCNKYEQRLLGGVIDPGYLIQLAS